MRTLVFGSLLVVVLILTLVPLSVAGDLTPKVKVVCAFKDGSGNVTIVPIPDKEAVLLKCVEAGGTVIYFEEIS